MAENSKIFCCAKYALMACNAFGIMLGIFVVLFGISFPAEVFPGGFLGQTTAIISILMIFFTMIGYCGAHHQKAYFLIIYSLIIIIFIGSNILSFFLAPDMSIFDPEGKTFYIVTIIMTMVLIFACILTYQIRRKANESKIALKEAEKLAKGLKSLPSQQTEITLAHHQQQQQQHQQQQQQQQQQLQQHLQHQQQLQIQQQQQQNISSTSFMSTGKFSSDNKFVPAPPDY